MPRKAHSQDWIRTLAEPYLRGYEAEEVTQGPLRGFRFFAPGHLSTTSQCGFFAGHLIDQAGFEFLKPQQPECLVFAFVEPTGGDFYRRLVSAQGSLLRATADYIPWLTHHPPRFVFTDGQAAVLVRHIPMGEWPASRREHYSRNFYTETFAWLVRSALVRKLAGVDSAQAARG